jgi:uncharacterized membrane protein
MSQLIVIGYRQQHRASEVLIELRQRDWSWAEDLNHAIVVKRDANDKPRVDLSVDPMTRVDIAWARLWGGLLSLLLADPVTRGMVEAAQAITGDFRPLGSDAAIRDANWWIDEMQLSREFLRRAGAILDPGESALFMLVHSDDPGSVLVRLWRDSAPHHTQSGAGGRLEKSTNGSVFRAYGRRVATSRLVVKINLRLPLRWDS